MTQHAKGSFEVKMVPQAAQVDPTLGRFVLDKSYSGDLEAVAKGEMLTAGTEVKGSAVYVAVERVTGKLHSKNGSFALVHHGKMTRGAPELAISVVPDSGTGELVGLAGKLAITVADGKHFYDLEFTLGETR